MPVRTAKVTREGREASVRTYSSLRARRRGLHRVVGAAMLSAAAAMTWAGGIADGRAMDGDGATDGGDATGGGDATDGGGATDGGPSEGGPSADGTDKSQALRAPSIPRAVDGGVVAVPGADRPAFSNQQSVVTGSRSPASAAREDRASTSSVLSPSDSPRVHEDLGTLLLEVPGANVTRRGGIGSFAMLSLRGSNPDEVRIYIDGIPLNQAIGGAVDLSTLPLGDVDRVEIYRGTTPIAFGESALGGVVSILTRTPDAPRASVRAGAGSFNTTFADATAGGAVGSWRLYAGLHALRAIGDFPYAPASIPGAPPPGNRRSNDLQQLDGVARAVVAFGRRELRAGVIGVWRDQGLPAKDMFPSVTARGETARLLGYVNYESRSDLGESSRLRASLFASAIRDEFSDPSHVAHDVTRSIGGTVTPEKALGGWGRLSGLVDARVEDFLPRNDVDPATPAGYPARRAVAAVGSEIDLHIAPLGLDLIPSARIEGSHDVRTGRASISGANLPPQAPIDRLFPVLRVGFLRPLSDRVSLRGNAGRYARIPSFLELYGYNLNVSGNPGLRPEQGVNADVGVVVGHAGPLVSLSASATLFGAKVDDLIAWQTYPNQTRAENVSRARVGGIETELRFQRRRLTLIVQATLTDARDEGDIAASRDQQIAYHPRYRSYARGEWRQPIASTPLTIRGYADLDGTAGNHTATSRSAYSQLPARALLGAGLAIEHARAGLRLSANAFNLVDSRVYDFPDYPLPGRSVFVALGWSSVNSVSTGRADPISARPQSTSPQE